LFTRRKKFGVADGRKCDWMKIRCTRMIVYEKINCRTREFADAEDV
jgi:hypothetical protein